jgi:cytidine deaminase
MKLFKEKDLPEKVIQNMIQKAKFALNDSHTLYESWKKYGSCVYTSKRKYYHGFNIISATHTLTLHAEQVALVNATLNLDTKIKAIAVASDDNELDPVPCGICLQLLYENARFSKIDIKIISIRKEQYRIYHLSELYPVHWPDREPNTRK